MLCFVGCCRLRKMWCFVMVGSFVRLAAAAAFCLVLAACTGAPESAYNDGAVASPDAPLQCVPYARAHSGIALRGNAYTWWDQAAGRYARTEAPSQGSVLVLYNYAGPNRAHLAVVRNIVSTREIRIDHANWLDDGAVYLDDPVRDVSVDNDWSQVRVYNLRTASWGARVYPVQGFISADSPDTTMRMAQNPPARTAAADPIGALIGGGADALDPDN